MTDWATQIRRAREKNQWTMEQTALALRIQVSEYKRLEHGTLPPDDGLVKKLEKALGIRLGVDETGELA